MKTKSIIYSVVTLFALLVPAWAEDYHIRNYSGESLPVDLGFVVFYLPPGESRIVHQSEDEIVFWVGSTNEMTIDLSGVTGQRMDFTVTKNTASLDGHGLTGNGWFAWGFGIGLTWFGFGYVLRLIRAVAAPGGDDL